jgi:uncharacterized membrane protein
MSGSMMVLAAASAFVLTHFLLSHPLRRPLVSVLGEKGFMLVYSGVALATFAATVRFYKAAPGTAPLWAAGDGLWAFVSAAMLFASILLLGSFIRNPALPGAAASAAKAEARGVYAVTRHPMMWSFAIWGACHILVHPVEKNIILAGAIIVLALVGAALQDRKKAAHDPQGWAAWQGRTSYWPFAAIVQGRTRFGGFGAHAIGGGILLWLLATWLHLPASGAPAGIWRWLT